MANPDAPPAAITLELESDWIPADVFRKTVDAFVKSLYALTDEVCGDEKAIGWEISVKEGSVRVAGRPNEASSPVAMQLVHDAVVAEPDLLRPHFSDIAQLGVEGIHLWIGEERQAIAHIKSGASARPQTFDEYGTVEGDLEMMSSRGSPHFMIYEPIWDRGVRCTVPDNLLGAMPNMWTKRVAAHGVIHYNAEGYPVSIKADEIALFPYDETPIEVFRGILRAD